MEKDLTADMVARAVIAAARIYGDDPLEVLQASTMKRRAVVAAASALEASGLVRFKELAPMLAIRSTTVHHARKAARPRFLRAAGAATRAIEYSRWRPDAAASVVAAPPAIPRATAVEAAASVRDLHAEIARPLRAQSGGMLSAMVRPTYSPPAGPPPERSLGDRILDELADGPVSAAGLATRLDVKELPVSQTIRALAQAGHLVGGDIPFEGRRFQKWSRA